MAMKYFVSLHTRSKLTGWWGLLGPVIIATASAAATDCALEADGTCQQQANIPPIGNEKCGVYMAPSTLGEETNMGIYTGIPLKDGELVRFPEIAIPLLFREWGEHTAGFDDGTLWDRYIWEGDVMGIESYVDTNREKTKAVFVPGVGCTVNSILDMNNIKSTHGSVYDTMGMHRSRDPGTGAFTPYHAANTKAITDIPAGAELFASYGDYWIPDIPGVQVTLEEPLNRAENFLRNHYLPWIKERDGKLSPSLKQGLWEFTRSFPIYDTSFTNLPRVDFDKVQSFWKENKSVDEDNVDNTSIVRHFIRQQSIRSPEWLEEHGYCQDHLRPGRSTIPQAGYGAFATRFLPAGTVVGYSPLVHMGYYGRDVLTIRYPDGHLKFDLVINYSFGHPNSTLLLTPYGGMVNYINHSPKAPNVAVRWPDKELIAHKPHWLRRAPETLRDTIEKIGLSFEYVALRDIQPGEEVFMDYGPEWETAWQEHIREWTPVDDASQYMHSSLWTEKTFRTAAELEENPYPPNLVTMCYESYSATDEDGVGEWLPVLRPLQYRVYCDVLDRIDPIEVGQNSTYNVEMRLNSGGTIVVRNVEQTGIFLYDRAFSQDWHLPNAFRHEIKIPDEIMPPAWLNGPAVPQNERQF